MYSIGQGNMSWEGFCPISDAQLTLGPISIKTQYIAMLTMQVTQRAVCINLYLYSIAYILGVILMNQQQAAIVFSSFELGKKVEHSVANAMVFVIEIEIDMHQ